MDAAVDTFNSILISDININVNYKPILKGTHDIKEIVHYALADGKRIRPVITGSMCQWSNNGFVLFIEYIHAASIIIDDLPCMDNDTLRRGKPTLHIKYGEHIAQLTAYNITFAGLMHLNQGLEEIKPLYQPAEYTQIMTYIQNTIYVKLGFQGICGGQYMDLAVNKTNMDNRSEREQKEVILKLMRMKTGDLFGISFILGWLGRGGAFDKIAQVEEAGIMLGLCYQIIDDVEDYSADYGKNEAYNNICRYYTHNELIDLFMEKINTFAKTSTRLKILTPEITYLYKLFLNKFKKHIGNSKEAC
jgi:geranylgeranyl diphosphate synthase type II